MSKDKLEENWWAKAVRNKLTDCAQDMPRMITEIHTALSDCPYTQPDVRAALEHSLTGALRHGELAAWRGLSRGERIYSPWMHLPPGLRHLPAWVWGYGAACLVRRYEADAIDPNELAAWGAVCGPLPERQSRLL